MIDFNSYGSRRGNHEVMMRGTFANVRIKNLMLPPKDDGTRVEGGLTLLQPSGEQMSIYDAAMRYIADHTTIPVPFVLHYGMTDESPGRLGPFIIMEYIDNAGDMVDVLRAAGHTPGEKPVLDPDIDEEKLEHIYGQIADIMLQLASCDFSRIGSLGTRSRDGDDIIQED